MQRNKRRVALRALYASLILVFLAAEVQAADTTFNVPAQPMSKALVAIALQARLSISHTGIDFKNVICNPVEGRFAPEDAMRRLLSGTGYDFVFLDPETIQIRDRVATIPRTIGAPLIEEMIVTASKRDEIARLAPYSMLVLTSDNLSANGISAPNELTRAVAGLTSTNLGAGQDNFFFRGLSDSVFTGRSQSSVGLYLDDVRTTEDAPDPGLRLIDLERVEIIRGPQGTLYGSGTLGGLIRIITNKPVLDTVQTALSVSSGTTANGGPSAGVSAMLNVPIVSDVLGVRTVIYRQHDGGYIDNTRLGRDNINRTDTTGERLALRWRLNDSWTTSFNLTNQVIGADDSQYSEVGLPPLKQANFIAEPHRDHFFQSSINIEGDLGWARLASSSAYTERAMTDRYDASLAWHSLTGFPQGLSVFRDSRNIRSISHETRLNSPASGTWSWTSGVFFSVRDEDYHSQLEGPDTTASLISARSETRNDHAHDIAFFGEATYPLTDWLSLTGGARLFYSDLSASSEVGRSTSNTLAFAAGRNSATGMTRKIALNWHPDDHLTFYASVSEGFRLGGVNINSPIGAININAPANEHGEKGDPNAKAFSSDRLRTYELGTKLSFLNGRVAANAAAWITQWNNVQSNQILADGSFYIANIGDVLGTGFEVDMSVQPINGLQLRGNFFWTDPKISYPNPLLFSAHPGLPGVPEMGFGFSVRYDFAISPAYYGFAGFDYTYVGGSRLGFDEKLSPAMGSYSISNLRFGISNVRWEADLYINNLTDERSNSFAYGNPFLFGNVGQITPLRPLTVGLELSWKY